MTVAVSAAVMAHPSRSARAYRLAERLAVYRARVVLDPEPDGPPSSLRTARRAWAAVGDDATHHLVIQDDAVPLPSLEAAVARAVASRRHDAVALFTEWGSYTSYALRLAALAGEAYAPILDRYVPSVALLLPAAVARDFAAATADGETKDDVALAGFLAGAGIPIAVAVPCPVDHRNPESLTGNGRMGDRKSTRLNSSHPSKSRMPSSA